MQMTFFQFISLTLGIIQIVLFLRLCINVSECAKQLKQLNEKQSHQEMVLNRIEVRLDNLDKKSH